MILCMKNKAYRAKEGNKSRVAISQATVDSVVLDKSLFDPGRDWNADAPDTEAIKFKGMILDITGNFSVNKPIEIGDANTVSKALSNVDESAESYVMGQEQYTMLTKREEE